MQKGYKTGERNRKRERDELKYINISLLSV